MKLVKKLKGEEGRRKKKCPELDEARKHLNASLRESKENECYSDEKVLKRAA